MEKQVNNLNKEPTAKNTLWILNVLMILFKGRRETHELVERELEDLVAQGGVSLEQAERMKSLSQNIETQHRE